MATEWQKLTELTGENAFEIERVRLVETGIAIEGRFDLPPLARLTAEDQIFVAAFVRCHGSIKQMEQYFGVSYPTIKNRLNRIGTQLPAIEMDAPASAAPEPRDTNSDLLDRLERGELTASDVLERLNKQKGSAK